MKITSAVFDISAPDLKSCPKSSLPEFAFIGRSNVGKSSLISLLAGIGNLAKASVTPGKTKLINFFLINRTWSLVDLPGYGYAKIGHKDRSDFNQAVADFLEKRRNLRCVFVLLDSRLPPQKIDLEFINWLLDTCTVPFALVFTKTDKQSHQQTQANVNAFMQSFAAWEGALPSIFLASTVNKNGRTDILLAIEKMIKKNPRDKTDE
jgi:GTP-binding protein